MSLVRQRLNPILDWFEGDALLPNPPHATQLVLVRNINIGTVQGHTYGQAGITINTAGTAISHLGDSHTMSNTAHSRSLLRNPALLEPVSPPPSENAVEDGSNTSPRPAAAELAPPEYKERDHDWFTPGRLFKIFSPQASEIHLKDFVLLDTKNKEGPSLLMRNYTGHEEASRGYFLRSHVLVQHYQASDQREPINKCKVVYMDEYEDHGTAHNAWIELEYLYSIAFAEYKYADCGHLDPHSLHDLRQYYVDWLKYHWRLG